MNNDYNVLSNAHEKEQLMREGFVQLFKACPIPENELMMNLGLFLNRQALSRILFMHELYQKIISVHGVVMEFGVRWGQNMALFQSFRGMYEPYNYNRKIIGFDTFTGFPEIDAKDGRASALTTGAYSVSENYEIYLEKILTYHENESPVSHLRKFSLVKGDAVVSIDQYLEKHPETLIALAYFDFDLYLPTKKCLQAIKGHLTKGSVLAFDELNYEKFPGETLALKEVFGLDRYKITRSPLNPLCSYLVID
ncbi:MAG: crotonobetainyl-CoA--carnitine CoA-transferase [Candidatus Sericytochromatia bacterium]|nr:crotonobetainyl-CoA--carnitine CoA-transferase [Candidatus Sericytochromatia bacterium]